MQGFQLGQLDGGWHSLCKEWRQEQVWGGYEFIWEHTELEMPGGHQENYLVTISYMDKAQEKKEEWNFRFQDNQHIGHKQSDTYRYSYLGLYE